MISQSKTASELEKIVNDRMAMGDVFVSVQKDSRLGWRANVVIAPKLIRAQETADRVSADLRKDFKLRD